MCPNSPPKWQPPQRMRERKNPVTPFIPVIVARSMCLYLVKHGKAPQVRNDSYDSYDAGSLCAQIALPSGSQPAANPEAKMPSYLS